MAASGRLEVADVFRQYGERFLSREGRKVSLRQRRAPRDTGARGTARRPLDFARVENDTGGDELERFIST